MNDQPLGPSVRKFFNTSAKPGFAFGDGAATAVRLKNKKIIMRIGVFKALGLRGSILKVYILHFEGFAFGPRPHIKTNDDSREGSATRHFEDAYEKGVNLALTRLALSLNF